MNKFADLCSELDQSITLQEELLILSAYFESAASDDRLWAIELLLGTRPKRLISADKLKSWTLESTKLPDWLVQESISVVGNLTETMALVLPKTRDKAEPTLSECLRLLEKLKGGDEKLVKEQIKKKWFALNVLGRLLFNKLLTGGFRLKLSRKIISRALAKSTGIEEYQLSHRLCGNWNPRSTTFIEFIDCQDESDLLAEPYPFHEIVKGRDLVKVGDAEGWKAEKQLDGMRCQLIIRGGQYFLWSEADGMVTDYFPEFKFLREQLPDGTVIEGTIIARKSNKLKSKQTLIIRLKRSKLPNKLIAENPVKFIGHDLLEKGGRDIRASTLEYRRAILERTLQVVQNRVIEISECFSFDSWEELQKIGKLGHNSSAQGGMILKHSSSLYDGDSISGNWWEWKPKPFTLDAVVLYVKQGQGEKSNLFTEFTLGVWKEDELLTIAKIDTGLSDSELLTVKKYVEENTVDRFGPVRTIVPQLVFEIAFEGVQTSRRHKSGMVLRSPKLLNWKKRKSPEEASHLEDLIKLR